MILDLSFPQGSPLNAQISKDFYLGRAVSLTYPSIDNLVEFIKKKGTGCLLI